VSCGHRHDMDTDPAEGRWLVARGLL
jgi:hypothetical protein